MSARRVLGLVEDWLRADKGDEAVDELFTPPEVHARRDALRARSLAVLRGEVMADA